MKQRVMIAAALVLALFVAGCGGDDEASAPDADGAGAETPDDTDTGDDAADDAGSDALTSGCRAVEPDGDVYAAADGGEAEIRPTGDALELVEIRPAEGWEGRIDDEEREEIEIDFVGPDRVLELEVEVDDGRVEADVCVED